MNEKTFETHASELVSQMTLDEKISQMMNTAPVIERLGIPAYNWWNECLHGVGRGGIATVFSQAIGLAATRHVQLVHQVAVAISDEARAKFRACCILSLRLRLFCCFLQSTKL